jgi:hypothetical protein
MGTRQHVDAEGPLHESRSGPGARAMFREMDMRFWLEEAEKEMRRLEVLSRGV